LISYGGELLDASQEQHATHVIHSGNASCVVSSQNTILHVTVFENDTGHATCNIWQVVCQRCSVPVTSRHTGRGIVSLGESLLVL